MTFSYQRRFHAHIVLHNPLSFLKMRLALQESTLDCVLAKAQQGEENEKVCKNINLCQVGEALQRGFRQTSHDFQQGLTTPQSLRTPSRRDTFSDYGHACKIISGAGLRPA